MYAAHWELPLPFMEFEQCIKPPLVHRTRLYSHCWFKLWLLHPQLLLEWCCLLVVFVRSLRTLSSSLHYKQKALIPWFCPTCTTFLLMHHRPSQPSLFVLSSKRTVDSWILPHAVHFSACIIYFPNHQYVQHLLKRIVDSQILPQILH